MNLPVSKRLLACAAYIRPDDVVADVGCDHGYLGIYLLTEGIAKRVIASDINEGPLQSARRNAEKYGVTNKMTFYLSDGVAGIPRDFDTLICAGMGADTMISILSAAPWLKSDRYRLILQCQSKTPLLRRYLSENGWSIAKESVLKDGRFLYTVMEVLWAPGSSRLSVGGWYISPALLENSCPETKEYCRRIIDGLRLAVAHRDDPEKKQALTELESLQ
ncbi:MAG: SAM-dependent methyltransferase [Ruminococcaceae bacterium]|nr:SAM-dependent methyltransferase [Oscillospiraceae bacterium]